MCLCGGSWRTGQFNFSDTLCTAYSSIGSSAASQCFALFLPGSVHPYQMLIEEIWVAWEAASSWGSHVSSMGDMRLLSEQGPPGGNPAIECDSGSWCFQDLPLGLGHFRAWVRRHSFSIQHTEHLALKYEVFIKGCICPGGWMGTLLTIKLNKYEILQWSAELCI